MDKLEKFIRDNRSDFDDKDPPDKIWHHINTRLDSGGKQVFLKNQFWKAAAVLLFVLVIWLMIDRQKGADQINLNQIETTEGIAFKEVEDYYYRLIDNKQQQILTYLSEHPEIDRQLTIDVEKLDSSYNELKKKLVRGPNEKVIDAMVVNLQTRIEILNQQLHVLERIKNLKEQEDDTKNI